MALQDRLSLYRSIEEIRQRPLVVYATSSRQNAKGNMAADVIPQLLDQINTISPRKRGNRFTGRRPGSI
jgi:hypothetical protein